LIQGFPADTSGTLFSVKMASNALTHKRLRRKVSTFAEDTAISPRNDGLRTRELVLYSAMANSYPTIIPGLRSPFDQIKGIVYFGRMVDKIRLSAAGKLPEVWEAARGLKMAMSFDARCCRFLHIDYAALEKETLKGGTDEELIAWVFKNGRQPSEEEIEIWNTFMTKRGWRDAGTQRFPPGARSIAACPHRPSRASS